MLSPSGELLPRQQGSVQEAGVPCVRPQLQIVQHKLLCKKCTEPKGHNCPGLRVHESEAAEEQRRELATAEHNSELATMRLIINRPLRTSTPRRELKPTKTGQRCRERSTTSNFISELHLALRLTRHQRRCANFLTSSRLPLSPSNVRRSWSMQPPRKLSASSRGAKAAAQAAAVRVSEELAAAQVNRAHLPQRRSNKHSSHMRTKRNWPRRQGAQRSGQNGRVKRRGQHRSGTSICGTSCRPPQSTQHARQVAAGVAAEALAAQHGALGANADANQQAKALADAARVNYVRAAEEVQAAEQRTMNVESWANAELIDETRKPEAKAEQTIRAWEEEREKVYREQAVHHDNHEITQYITSPMRT